MKKTLLASTAILALSAIGFTNTAHATEESTKKVDVKEGDVSPSLALTNPDVTSVNFDFEQIDFEKEKPLDPVPFSVTYDIQNKTFANIDEGRFTIKVSTDGDGLDANIKGISEKVFDISQTDRGTRNTGDVIIEATLDPTLYNDEQNQNGEYEITVRLIDSTTIEP